MFEGLNSRHDFGSFLNGRGLTGMGAEVGVAYGENAKFILDEWSGERIYLIDPYKKWAEDEYIDGTSTIDFEGAFNYAINHLQEHVGRCEWLRMTSDEAYKHLRDNEVLLDFAYIDGNHHQPQIGRDLENYWNLVRSGGIFCGHDFYNLDTPEYKCEVKDAVEAFAGKHGVEIYNTKKDDSWWIVKP